MVRAAILGLGGVAERIHLPACRAIPEVEVVAASEPVAATRDRMARQFQLARVYEDSPTLLAEQRPEVVIIGTPPDSHYTLCLRALEHGAHVLCEKPFMQSVEEADNVIAFAKAHKRYLAVNNQYRYMKLYRETRRRLEAGEFGRLYSIQCWQQMFHPPTHEKVGWRAGLRQSTLYEFGTHALDLICYLFGELPETLSAHMPRVSQQHDSDVLVQMTLRFPAERLATLAMNRVSHAPERYLEMRLDCEKASLRLSLGGVARASVEWSRRLGRPTSRFSLVRGGEGRIERGGRSVPFVSERHSDFAPATARHLTHFLHAMRQDPLDYQPLHHAREVLRLALAGYEAAAAGETLRFCPP